MPTRSRIAILNSDGSVDSIYCHYDGYLSHNGVILAKYYNNEEKIRKLISLGSLSFLGKSAEFFKLQITHLKAQRIILPLPITGIWGMSL